MTADAVVRVNGRRGHYAKVRRTVPNPRIEQAVSERAQAAPLLRRAGDTVTQRKTPSWAIPNFKPVLVAKAIERAVAAERQAEDRAKRRTEGRGQVTEYGVFECGMCELTWPAYVPPAGDPWVRCPSCSMAPVRMLEEVEWKRPQLVAMLATV